LGFYLLVGLAQGGIDVSDEPIRVEIVRYDTEPETLRDALRDQGYDCDLIVHRDGWTVFGRDLDADAVRAAVEAWADGEGIQAVPDPDVQFRQAVGQATSVADLKAALLGGNGSPGAEPRRGRPE